MTAGSATNFLAVVVSLLQDRPSVDVAMPALVSKARPPSSATNL